MCWIEFQMPSNAICVRSSVVMASNSRGRISHAMLKMVASHGDPRRTLHGHWLQHVWSSPLPESSSYRMFLQATEYCGEQQIQGCLKSHKHIIELRYNRAPLDSTAWISLHAFIESTSRIEKVHNDIPCGKTHQRMIRSPCPHRRNVAESLFPEAIAVANFSRFLVLVR